MSDQLNEFDRVFREKLSGQAVSPPESVWENIEAKRTFGHVVANRISTHWQTFGTLLLLLLGGGASISLLGGEEQDVVEKSSPVSPQVIAKLDQPLSSEKTVAPNSKELNFKDFISPSLSLLLSEQEKNEEANLNHEFEEEQIPDIELIASIHQAAFTRPQLKDQRLNSYINELDGWETAKPVSFVHYYEMDQSPKLSIHKDKLIQEPIRAKKLDFDYVMPKVERKSFGERSSLLLAFTPQTIHKMMTPEFNLSSSYLEERAKTENTRLAYTLTANLHYELKNNKFLETGVNFTQIYEEMSYEGEKRFSNQYDFVEIPLLLGYQERNAKWGWHFKGGFGFQVYNNYKGYILKKIEDPDAPVLKQTTQTSDNPEHRLKKSEAVINIITNNHKLSEKQDRHGVYDLSKDDENPFKTSGVVNIHLAAGLTYYHSIKTSFVISPHYTRSVNSITKESARFKERISYMGITLGTRIKF